MLKKIGSFLLIAVMLMAVLTPFTIVAAQSGQCGANLTWKLDDSGTLTISGTGDMWNWTLNSFAPWYSYRSFINNVVINYGVTSIGDNAFYLYNSLTSINIPSSVTSIGNNAFCYCESLTSISIPSSVTSIGGAFNGCDSLVAILVDSSNTEYSNDEYGVLFNKNKTKIIQYPNGRKETTYTIPSSVTSIGEGAFYHCESLTSISIPSGVTSIGDFAFYYCYSLTSINIPSSVTSIGDYAFQGCLSLTSINIPSSVTSIGEEAFSSCDSLVAILVNSSNTEYSNDEYGVIFNKNKTKIIRYPNGRKETTYTIPSSVTSIGNNAFSGCDSLASINIPDSVTGIGYCAFYHCESLTSISIPSGVTSIGEKAFFGCDSLASINIPDSVTSIGDFAFSGCTSLTSISIDANNAYYCDIDGVVFSKDKTVIHIYPGGKKETSYTIPSSVTSIGDYAFEFCANLTSISIPSSVTSIGFWAFYECESLADIYYAGSEAMWRTLAMYADVPKKTKVHYYSVAPGTVIGSALRTNITAEINGHAIPSFNVDGYTYIVAEDLKDYGFFVYYDNSTRTLAINRDDSKAEVTRSYVKPYVPKSEVGIKEHNLVATDIVTYLDNNYVQSYNINGLTIIPFNDLGRYGAVYYDNVTRVIKVTIPGLN